MTKSITFKLNPGIMNRTILFLIFCFFVNVTSSLTQTKTCNIYFDSNIPQLKFSITELNKELAKKGIVATSNGVKLFPGKTSDISIIVTFQNKEKEKVCKLLNVKIPTPKKSQSYSVRVKKEGEQSLIAVLAFDANGGMYGTMDVTEAIKIGTLKEILKVPGLDVVLIGPHDLSCNLGVPEKYDHPKFKAAVEKIITSARKASIGVGIHAFFEDSVEREIEWAGIGANLILHSGDINLFSLYVKKEIQELKETLGDERKIASSEINI